jgi:hypothetical protein
MVVDESISLATLDGFANPVARKAFAFEALPQLRFGEPPARE